MRSEKELEFYYAPDGIISLDCSVGLYVKALIETKVIDWVKLIELMTSGGAKVLGLNKGTLAVGAEADITVIDHKSRWTVDTDKFRSKSRNCPYNGWELTGRAAYTIVGGQVRYKL